MCLAFPGNFKAIATLPGRKCWPFLALLVREEHHQKAFAFLPFHATEHLLFTERLSVLFLMASHDDPFALIVDKGVFEKLHRMERGHKHVGIDSELSRKPSGSSREFCIFGERPVMKERSAFVETIEIIANDQVVHALRGRRFDVEKTPSPGKRFSERGGWRPGLRADGHDIVVHAGGIFGQRFYVDLALQQCGLLSIRAISHQAASVSDFLRFLIGAYLPMETWSFSAQVHVRLVVIMIPIARLVFAWIFRAALAHVPCNGAMADGAGCEGLVHRAFKIGKRDALFIPGETKLIRVCVIEHEIAADEREISFFGCAGFAIARESAETRKDLWREGGFSWLHGWVDDERIRHSHAQFGVASAIDP